MTEYKYIGAIRSIMISVTVVLLVLFIKGAIYNDEELEHSTSWISAFLFRILFLFCIGASCFLSLLLIYFFYRCYKIYIDDLKKFWQEQKERFRCFQAARHDEVGHPFSSESSYKAWQQRNKIWFVIEQLHLEQRQKKDSNRESESTWKVSKTFRRLFCCSSKQEADHIDYLEKSEPSFKTYNLPTPVILMPESSLKDDFKTPTPTPNRIEDV